MNNLKDRIKQLAAEYFSEIIEIRRHLHMHPELSMHEHHTAQFIASTLKSYDIPFQEGIAGTGIVGLIQGREPLARVIALRADMDALPMEEKNDVLYRSKVNHVMHACGHDVHMASLLGTAKILQTLSGDFKGSVKLIFQPSEEQFPGGAIMMINEGVLENPKVDKIFGQHVFPDLDAGKIGLRPGKYMAATDEIHLTIKGRGGHGATPDLNIDPVVISAHIILALQEIVSRMASPVNPTVLSIGRIIADGMTNIIPDEVVMGGTLRTFDDRWRDDAIEKIGQISRSIASGFGGTSKLHVDKGYPSLYNDPDTSLQVRHYAAGYIGTENTVELNMRMTAEDFAYYAQRIPGCFYRLGIRNEEKGITSNLHNATFDVDETSLETGMGFMAWIAVNELNK
jgi:amidohydrolase